MLNIFTSFVSTIFEALGTFIEALTAPLFLTNELTFFTHSVLIGVFAILAVRLGRGALTSFTALCWVLGNLFVIKEATIFGLDVITADSFAIGSNIGITLIQYYYGEKAAKNSIIVGIYSACFFLVMAKVHLIYIPNMYDTTHPFFYAILSRMTRIVIGSFSVAFISMNLNLYLFKKISARLGEGFFGISSFLSLTVSQFIDTTLFTFCALYGDVHSALQIIVFSSLVKCAAIAITVPAVSLCKTFISKPADL